jgi:pimeloyl-ACP methyl ester carboxylesterase
MTKPDLLLLHGALGATIQFQPLIPLLTQQFTIHTLNFEGHGDVPARDRPFRIEHFVENVLDYLVTGTIQTTRIFGYSMGGYVASQLAASHPETVHSIATLGTKFYWDSETAAREIGFLDPDKIRAKVPHFADALDARHTAAGWQAVLRSTAGLLNSLGDTGGLRAPTLAQVQCPVRVIVGDRDRTVGVPETHEVYRALPQGQLEVLPATVHELERVPVERLVYSLTKYFQ